MFILSIGHYRIFNPLKKRLSIPGGDTPGCLVMKFRNQVHECFIFTFSYFFKLNNENVGEAGHFSIDPETGEVRAKVRFDREEREKYELVLVARDHGTPVAFETLR